tara:strand:+ start:2167 stop:2997 length:831 start_codon:yes stop_codon:yes gene_type:complete
MGVFSGPTNDWINLSPENSLVGIVTNTYGGQLILALDAGRTLSYSGIGSTWYDLTSNNRNFTRTSSSEVVYDSNGWFDWTDGPSYDSTQGCFTLPGSSLTLGSYFTIEIWNYYDAASTPNSGSDVNPWVDGCLWTNSASADWSSGAANNNGLLFGYNSLVHTNTYGTETQVDYSTNPSTQTWHQHVLVSESWPGPGAETGKIANVYVDKVNVASMTTFAPKGQSQGTYGIGIADKSGSNYRGEYNGRISIVRIYSSALTPAEIAQNYDAVKNRYGF